MMTSEEYRQKHWFFYLIYLLANIVGLGSPWFFTELIAYGIAKGNEQE